MSVEIERKFLVMDPRCIEGVRGERFVQGWISRTRDATVRIRIGEGRAWLTIKGRSEGISRLEFEYPIPVADAEQCMSELCDGAVIDKTRYLLPVGQHIWEVDVFGGENTGLVLAEVELSAEDEAFERPGWIGEEVSLDPRYFNSNLVKNPFSRW